MLVIHRRFAPVKHDAVRLIVLMLLLAHRLTLNIANVFLFFSFSEVTTAAAIT